MSEPTQSDSNYNATNNSSYSLFSNYQTDAHVKENNPPYPPTSSEESAEEAETNSHSKLYAIICEERKLSSSGNRNSTSNSKLNKMSSEERAKLRVKGSKDALIQDGKDKKELRRGQDNRLERYAEKENKDLKKTDNPRNAKRFAIIHPYHIQTLFLFN